MDWLQVLWQLLGGNPNAVDQMQTPQAQAAPTSGYEDLKRREEAFKNRQLGLKGAMMGGAQPFVEQSVQRKPYMGPDGMWYDASGRPITPPMIPPR